MSLGSVDVLTQGKNLHERKEISQDYVLSSMLRETLKFYTSRCSKDFEAQNPEEKLLIHLIQSTLKGLVRRWW